MSPKETCRTQLLRLKGLLNQEKIEKEKAVAEKERALAEKEKLAQRLEDLKRRLPGHSRKDQIDRLDTASFVDSLDEFTS